MRLIVDRVQLCQKNDLVPAHVCFSTFECQSTRTFGKRRESFYSRTVDLNDTFGVPWSVECDHVAALGWPAAGDWLVRISIAKWPQSSSSSPSSPLSLSIKA